MRDRPPAISTARLELLVLLPEEIRALICGDTARAGQLIGAFFPPGWPASGEARDGLAWHLSHLLSDERHLPWRIRAIVERSMHSVVGSVTLKGPPDESGDVELGWGINEALRCRGYAFEASSALAEWALGQPRVRSLSATILDDNLASQRLAAKLGMYKTGETRRKLPLWRRDSLPVRRDELPKQQES